MRAGAPVHLRPQTYEVLRYLTQNKGRLVSKDQIIEEVWQGRAVTDGALGKCIEELREAFGADARQYIRNVRGRGYILDFESTDVGETVSTHVEEIDVVRVVMEDEAGFEKVSTTQTDSNQRSNPAARPRAQANGVRKTIALFTAGLVVLVAAAGIYFFLRGRQSSAARIQSIAVLPFKNESGNRDVDYLSDGMTDSLINSLSQVPDLSVKARGSVARYQDKQVDPLQAGSELSVQAILTGRFVQRGDDLTLYLSLIDVRNGNQIWGEQYDRKMTGLSGLQRETARDIARTLTSNLKPADERKLSSGISENSEAYRAYLRGRYYWNNPRLGGYEKSREYFQQSIDLDPNYARGYSGLSHYYGFGAAVGFMPPDENWIKSETFARKALDLDPNLGEAYNALIGSQLYYHRDWAAAERSFRRGLDLDPNSAELRHHFARCLMLFGRRDEALAQMQRTLELEPLSLNYNLGSGRLFFYLRQYDQAVDQLRKTIELEPNYFSAHEWLGFVYEKIGRESDAVAEWALARRSRGDEAAVLKTTYARSGFSAAVKLLARNRLAELDKSVKRGEYVASVEYVTAYTRLGDKEQALQWLEKAIQEKNGYALEFNLTPLFDSLRSDPRFQELVNRVSVTSSKS